MPRYTIVEKESKMYLADPFKVDDEEISYTHDIELALIKNSVEEIKNCIVYNEDEEYIYKIDDDIEFGDDKI